MTKSMKKPTRKKKSTEIFESADWTPSRPTQIVVSKGNKPEYPFCALPPHFFDRMLEKLKKENLNYS